ncbi:MAG: hypothetical protein KDB61_15365, partial [Planctomycetes bacterium]|nr:hypothetical protein [Planctomycetota bacterium]
LSAEENSFLSGEHLRFARDHIAVGSYESAVRSYRQAKRYAARATGGPDPAALRLEMAAALILSGQPDLAREESEGLQWYGLTALERNGVPEWALAVLPIVPK